MTLGRLALAWLPVAGWFLLAAWAGRRLAGPPLPAERRGRTWGAVWALAEAGVLTLFASLWFDSLGSGGWGLLFLLVGLLVAVPVRAQALLLYDVPRRAELVMACVDTGRYVAAGAILAWRLG